MFENASNGGYSCGQYSINPTVTVCNSVDNTYVQTTGNGSLRYYVQTYDYNVATALQMYVDGKLTSTQDQYTATFGEALTPGPHLIVTKAWDSAGASFRSVRHVTAYSGTPGSTCGSGASSAAICVIGATSSQLPIHIVANAYVGAPPTSAQLYIDGTLVINNYACNGTNCETGNTAVDTFQTLSSGSHLLVFKVWTIDGGPIETQQQITVQ